ncbi:MAG: helix-turn-helix domain-containing protein [Phycisphaerae bacterium]|nr:helix-turn-helix transcriptional regulator [Phycisphaerae bacterium]NIV00158.1 helix-turn-helix domain-containing protein [Phycisphaerae bacterium]NIV69693.1 helix-turn-helix domain-containing protein [Phycisphaerae bacterium]NIX28920.1 helix-turn-helix domain-containing protein [Phycisphaerae bacterium]
MERFGEKLRILRQRKGLTVRQLGAMLGVSGPYVVQMEQGYKVPNAAMIIKIARLFKVSTDQLMLDELELD